jgi:predicted AlkP superfamily pyrophosphatase or phosphodiesterase
MLHPDFVKPLYDSGCFSCIPPMIKYLFTGGDASLTREMIPAGLPTEYDTIILFFVDAFGWRFVQKYGDSYPFLRHLMDHGFVARITSQFPSTTAAHVTTIHTGLPVGQHGVCEWQFYEPQVDAIIAPLLFSFAGSKERETLRSIGLDPLKVFPATTIYQYLQQHGIASFVFQPQENAFSSYSRIMFQGATVLPYRTYPEALVNMHQLLAEQSSPAYFFLYFSHIDTICHLYGPNSAQFEAEIDTFLTVMDRLFKQVLRKQRKSTLFILTADHGQIEVDPATTLYLNLDPTFADVRQFMKTDAKGELLVPAGSSRDMFLYIKDEIVDEAQAYLAERLAGKAEVYKVQNLVEQNFFGALLPSAIFQKRVGDLVILPLKHESVWWYEKDKFEHKFYGHHGGLTAEEMEIPLFLYPIPS